MKDYNVLESKDIDKCTGCRACYNVCPNGAIIMEENFEGFLYPKINKEKCSNCGLCQKICPVLNPEFKNNDKPKCYAYMASDEIRAKSTSGGAFYVLAKEFINSCNYVAGAIWSEDYKVEHIVSNNIEDIEKMRGSKYLQSDTKDCYKNIKEILNKGKKVLFSGTPCQVAGLKSYLNKDYENLFCIDIICHGTPSRKVFKKYIEEEHILKDDEKWLNTNFRDKSEGWNPYKITTITNLKVESHPAKDDTFVKAFLKNLCLRKSCAICAFAHIPRQGDITIGDFWGIDKYKETKDYDDKKGISLVLINNKKGEILSELIKNSSKSYKGAPLEHAINGNKNLIRSSKANINRNLFFELIDTKSLKENIEICLKNKIDYLIVNFWDSKFNYGAMLTAYAIQEIVKSYGFIPKLLNNGERVKKDWYSGSWMEEFAKKYLNITNIIDYKEANKLSKNIKGVIFGSDQVLRLKYIRKSLKKYLLNWVEDDTRKIAIAPSFGYDKENYLKFDNPTKAELKNMKEALSGFSYLSCREKSGENIYKELFNLKADTILDPVFLIPKDKYDKILIDADITAKGKIVSYILEKTNPSLVHLKNMLANEEIIEINQKEVKLCNWLKALKDCKLFITDSFHGVCFSLILNKPFIYVENSVRGSNRFENINNLFKLDEFIYNKDIKLENILKADFDDINLALNQEICRCQEIIDKVFKENYSNNVPKFKQKNMILNINPEYIKKYIDYKRTKFLSKCVKSSKKEHYINKYKKLKYDIDWKY